MYCSSCSLCLIAFLGCFQENRNMYNQDLSRPPNFSSYIFFVNPSKPLFTALYCSGSSSPLLFNLLSTCSSQSCCRAMSTMVAYDHKPTSRNMSSKSCWGGFNLWRNSSTSNVSSDRGDYAMNSVPYLHDGWGEKLDLEQLWGLLHPR